MSNGLAKTGKASRAMVLLKARPTAEQLADRLAEPAPDGIELYLDGADISGDDWLSILEERIAAFKLPAGFVWVIEGPLRSLDGTFFDISRPTPANVEVIRRLVTFGHALGARAAVIHAMALVDDVRAFSVEAHDSKLRDSLELARLYAELCRLNGIIPTVENIPAVAKMREARFMHSLIGMEPRDLLTLCESIEGLRITLDVSHAQLYLNAASGGPEAPAELAPLVEYLAARREVANLDEYIDAIEPLILEAHFSNASGLLGEGLPYGEGDLDLDRVAARLGRVASFLVTETLEPDPNRAVFMREAQQRMTAALQRRDHSGALDAL